MINKLDIENLDKATIKQLISAEKYPDNEMEYNDIINQIEQSLIIYSNSYHCKATDTNRKIVYDFQMHTTPLETNFSIGLMFTEYDIHLVRFDFGNNLRHKNNVGSSQETVVLGSHVHFYAHANKYIPKNVVPIGSIKEFVNISKIKDALLNFIDYTNIKTSERR
ncbi:MAG: hypothetical protein Q3978_02395 [Limosilactobacillus gorillae]|jgi:hypothetical protein|uniref:DUF6978 family protein n=1 Tax=Limosilactobacillus gorillae TaxID=1450649 RepID=UPI000AC88E17|nr:hypothetical protein [Limosilactobacillus gorillae]MDO4855395.1 hypothetical protein [Limosilactobacillus gorillae]